ncbi:hypothetical protein KFU94_31865 [Chloroflexi bacterium TSY]|nr:hypothetical protein [Chloroflexi bacterium TSY]
MMNQTATFHAGENPEIIIDSVGGNLRITGRNDTTISVKGRHGTQSYTVESGTRRTKEDGQQQINHQQIGDTVQVINVVEASAEVASVEAGDIEVTADETEETPDEADASGEQESLHDIVRLGSFAGDCRLEVPSAAIVRVGNVSGDGKIYDVQGEITCASLGGNLKARRTGSIRAGSIGGEFRAKQIEGDISIQSAGGNSVLMDVHGAIEALKTGGNIVLSNVVGSTKATAGGNAKLHLTQIHDYQYEVSAGGDLKCYLPAQSNATIELESRAGKLQIRGVELDEEPVGGHIHFTMGNGDASLDFSAGGKIAFYGQTEEGRKMRDDEEQAHERDDHVHVDYDFDFGRDFDFDLERELGARLGHLGEMLSERVQAKVHKALQQAERAISEAMTQAEKRVAKAERQAEHLHSTMRDRRRGHRHEHRQRRRERQRQRRYATRTSSHESSPSAQAPKASAPASSPVVSDEERMMILRMVEEDKISVEQAEKLLAALNRSEATE